MATAFFGLVIGKEKTPLPTFPADDEIDFKLTNAALSSPAGKSEKVQLYIHYAEEKYLVCVLNSDTIPQASIELVFSSDIPIPVSFSIEGGSKTTRVHLTGFCSRQFDAIEGMDSDDDSDDAEREFLDRMIAGEFGEDSEEEESEEESDSDDDGPRLGIEEIKEVEPEPVPKKKKVAPSKSKASLMDIDEEAPKKKKQENQNKGNQNKGNQNKGNQNKGNQNKGNADKTPKTPQNKGNQNKGNKGNQNKGNQNKGNADKTPKTPQNKPKDGGNKGPKTPQNKTAPQVPVSERKPAKKNLDKKRKTSPSESSLSQNNNKKKKN